MWCGRPFSIRGFRVRLGEVNRSCEHILPDNVFGKLRTVDVCTACNSRLGSEVDDRLLNDGHIFNAGLDAGFTVSDLLPDFRVCGTSPEGEPFQYRVKHGKWRLQPSFGRSGFKIGAVEGCSSVDDLENAKRKMLAIVLSDKSIGVEESEAKKWVEELFQEFLSKQGQYTVYRARIRQGLRARPIHAKGTVTFTTHPWETQWGIAKIGFESASILLPSRLGRRVASALAQMREFVMARKPKHGIFKHTTLATKAQAQHEVEIAVHCSKFSLAVRMFKREQWTIAFDVFKGNRLASLNDYHLLVVNHCGSTADRPVRVFENGAESE